MQREPLFRFVMTFDVEPDGKVRLSTTRNGRFDAVYMPLQPGAGLMAAVDRSLSETEELSLARRSPP